MLLKSILANMGINTLVFFFVMLLSNYGDRHISDLFAIIGMFYGILTMILLAVAFKDKKPNKKEENAKAETVS